VRLIAGKREAIGAESEAALAKSPGFLSSVRPKVRLTREADPPSSAPKPHRHLEVAVDRHESLTVSVVKAAQLLGVSRALAYELVARGDLPSLRLGRRVVIPRRALEALVEGAEARQWSA